MKRFFALAAVLSAIACSGCIIAVKENDGAADPAYDDTGEQPHDDGGHVEEPAPPPRRERVVVKKRGEPMIGFYKNRSPNLPDMGRTKDYFRSHGKKGAVDGGYLRGDWKCYGSGIFKRGAGHGKTVIDGNLEIKGNNWRLTNITVTGRVKIRGNNNNITGLELRRPGAVSVKGSGNRIR